MGFCVADSTVPLADVGVSSPSLSLLPNGLVLPRLELKKIYNVDH